jgi:acetamidase/formamidase
MPGDLLHIRTRDCFGGAVKSVNDLPSRVCQFPYLNPVTGPFHVAGANPGDTLAIHLVMLRPSSDVGFSATFPHFGALTGTHTTAMLHPALPERVWQYDIDPAHDCVWFDACNPRADGGGYRVDLPLKPMLGTIGVAPAADEVRTSLVPDAHGGNLDTSELRAGTTLYLGVNQPGGLFAIGDGHALQGDGELCGVAVEVPMDVLLTVDIIPGVATPWPRIESDTHIMSVGVARPLEDAYRTAQHDLVTHVQAITGLDQLDAYQLVSQAGIARVGNVVDPNYTIVAGIAHDYLDGVSPYQNTHSRLRNSQLAEFGLSLRPGQQVE